MRVLSKYCTSRVPPGAFLYGSLVAKPGVGPQYHERFALPSWTGLSVRSQVRWNAGSAKLACAAVVGRICPTNVSNNANAATRRAVRCQTFMNILLCLGER